MYRKEKKDEMYAIKRGQKRDNQQDTIPTNEMFEKREGPFQVSGLSQFISLSVVSRSWSSDRLSGVWSLSVSLESPWVHHQADVWSTRCACRKFVVHIYVDMYFFARILHEGEYNWILRWKAIEKDRNKKSKKATSIDIIFSDMCVDFFTKMECIRKIIYHSSLLIWNDDYCTFFL